MTCRDIFDAALSFAAEDGQEPGGIQDYLERAPYILASFIGLAWPLDSRYRTAYHLPQAEPFHAAQIPLEAEFPLSPVFAAAASSYLAAMLVMDESEEMCDRLTSSYTHALASLEASLPAHFEKITDAHRWY